MAASTNDRRPWIRTNQALGTILTLLMLGLVFYVLLSPWMFREQRDGFLLGFVPLFAALLMLLLAATMIVDGRRRNDAREGSEATIAVTRPALLYGLSVLGVTALYAFTLLGLGFLLATPLFVFLGAYALGSRPWALVLIFSALLTGLVYLMFTSLGTVLPSGAWWQ